MVIENIKKLRAAMKNENVQYYMIPTADFHNSEYVSDYFKTREFFSGFTGSNGTLLIGEHMAGLWTDGRYFIQAEIELVSSEIKLFRMQEENVPTLEEFLKVEMKEGETLGFDGRVVDATYGLKLENILKENKGNIRHDLDLTAPIWMNRPQIPKGKVFLMPEIYAGKSMAEKVNDIRKIMSECEADYHLISKLDDLMWIFNIRGNDVECNPVALSFGLIGMKEIYIYLQSGVVIPEIQEYFRDNGVTILEYEKIYEVLNDMVKNSTLLIDNRNINFSILKTLDESVKVLNKINPSEKMKAVKNPIELKNMRETYIQDSVALTKFIYWLKNNIGNIDITEKSASNYLDHLRTQINGFLSLSFPTISAYKENAAMMHYEATSESNKTLEKDGMLLIDSGGQYYGGTTDVTRTIVLGSISDEIRMHFTLTVAGMLSLTEAKFLYGCSGRNLDILARKPLWDQGIDYKCGTGHGVGCCLNVHEGPQNIRWKYLPTMTEAVLEGGMVVTNEPGVYIKDSHGIRIENVMVVRNSLKNSDGQFMDFETLTYVPIDLEAIDDKYLDKNQLVALNFYHKEVYNKISPYLSEDEKIWLKNATKELIG